MKSTVETMESDTGIARSAWSVFAELVKARLTALVLLTTLSGFYLASSGSMDWLLLFNTLFGTGLLACGASVLNQYMERDLDALMPRTAKRPLPSGWMMPEKAFWFGVTLSLVGVLYLMWKVNLLTCVLGALTLGLYICVYTPLKRLTFGTLVGPPCASSLNGLDGFNRFSWGRGLVAVSDSFSLADASLPGHCLDVSRSI